MRSMLMVVLCCGILLAPPDATATTIQFDIDVDAGGGFVFGSTPFRMDAPLAPGTVFGGELVSGTVSIVSGTLLGLVVATVGEELRSFYRYGPGSVSIDAVWEGVPPRSIGFTGVLESLTLDLCEMRLAPILEPCDTINGGASGSVQGLLGPGSFDPVFASILGISGPSAGGMLSFFADGIDGSPSDASRVGGSASGTAQLTVIVPEPATGVLFLTAGLAVLTRAHRRRRR